MALTLAAGAVAREMVSGMPRPLLPWLNCLLRKRVWVAMRPARLRAAPKPAGLVRRDGYTSEHDEDWGLTQEGKPANQ